MPKAKKKKKKKKKESYTEIDVAKGYRLCGWCTEKYHRDSKSEWFHFCSSECEKKWEAKYELDQ